MKWSSTWIPTLRDTPKDAEAESHKLMLRGGYIRRLGSGTYSYLPLGWRVLANAIRIVREEIDRAGARECLLPAIHPLELWQRTGRDRALGDVLIRFRDRHDKLQVLGPTHEEVITSLVAGEVKSYKELPLVLYQIQTKFRDEPRPRFGIIRSREFLMKDAYSFDRDEAGLERSYAAMYAAYERIFQRCGLTVMASQADPGIMGGHVSHEFMAPADYGEDVVVRCAPCARDVSAVLVACSPTPLPSTQRLSRTPPRPLERVSTPGVHSVEEVSRFLKVEPAQLIKTLLYQAGEQTIGVLIRGDHDVNEVKLARVLKTTNLTLADPATIERLTGAPVGFSGPVGLRGIRLIADHQVLPLTDAVVGANAAGEHLRHIDVSRDVTGHEVADVRLPTAEDRCAACGNILVFQHAVEVGHVFKLGIKYTQALAATFQAPDGTIQPMIMGCYGIGINRIIACAIEQHHDPDGIIWPTPLSPFPVHLIPLDPIAETLPQAEALSRELAAAGLEPLVDDRELSAGVKLKDADLIGIPLRLVVSRRAQQQGGVELNRRRSKAREILPAAEVVSRLKNLLDTSPPVL